jgi:hypothetical protein
MDMWRLSICWRITGSFILKPRMTGKHFQRGVILPQKSQLTFASCPRSFPCDHPREYGASDMIFHFFQ